MTMAERFKPFPGFDGFDGKHRRIIFLYDDTPYIMQIL